MGCIASVGCIARTTGGCFASMGCNERTTGGCIASIGCIARTTRGCFVSGGCIQRTTEGCFTSMGCNENKNYQANNTDISRKNEVFAPEGFQRASGKPFGGAMGQSPISSNAASIGCIVRTTRGCFASIGCIKRTTEGCIASGGCNSAQPGVVLHLWVAL